MADVFQSAMFPVVSDSSGGLPTVPRPVAVPAPSPIHPQFSQLIAPTIADQSQGAFVVPVAGVSVIETIVTPQLLPNGSNEVWYGLNPVGAYSLTRTYYRLDLVEFNGASYVALRTSASGLPNDDGINWQLVAQAGLTGVSFIFDAAIPSNMWTIVHNLGRFPSVTIVDSAGNMVWSDVEYVDNNVLIARFASAFGGKAYLN